MLNERHLPTVASIMAGSHIKELVDSGDDVPVVVCTPLKFLKPVLHFVETDHRADFIWRFKP